MSTHINICENKALVHKSGNADIPSSSQGSKLSRYAITALGISFLMIGIFCGITSVTTNRNQNILTEELEGKYNNLGLPDFNVTGFSGVEDHYINANSSRNQNIPNYLNYTKEASAALGYVNNLIEQPQWKVSGSSSGSFSGSPDDEQTGVLQSSQSGSSSGSNQAPYPSLSFDSTAKGDPLVSLNDILEQFSLHKNKRIADAENNYHQQALYLSQGFQADLEALRTQYETPLRQLKDNYLSERGKIERERDAELAALRVEEENRRNAAAQQLNQKLAEARTRYEGQVKIDKSQSNQAAAQLQQAQMDYLNALRENAVAQAPNAYQGLIPPQQQSNAADVLDALYKKQLILNKYAARLVKIQNNLDQSLNDITREQVSRFMDLQNSYGTAYNNANGNFSLATSVINRQYDDYLQKIQTKYNQFANVPGTKSLRAVTADSYATMLKGLNLNITTPQI